MNAQPVIDMMTEEGYRPYCILFSKPETREASFVLSPDFFPPIVDILSTFISLYSAIESKYPEAEQNQLEEETRKIFTFLMDRRHERDDKKDIIYEE